MCQTAERLSQSLTRAFAALLICPLPASLLMLLTWAGLSPRLIRRGAPEIADTFA